jgi:hypothetical protein
MLRRWKFTSLLVAILSLLVARSFVTSSAALSVLLYASFLVVFVATILMLFERRRSRIGMAVLGLPSLAGILADYLFPAQTGGAGMLLFHFISAVFLLVTVVVVLKSVFRMTDMSADGVNGAFCGYLLLGLVFSHLYCLVDSVRPGSFAVSENVGAFPRDDGTRHALLTYFSVVTLTTLGYGDVTPHSGPAQTLAWVEAMLGQFYVAVIVAELLALKVSAAMRAQQQPDR